MSGQILIVEPIPTQRIMLRALLEKARYGVEHCSDITAAARLMACGLQPDIVLIRADASPGGFKPLAETIGRLKCGGAAPGLSWKLAGPVAGPVAAPLVIAIDDSSPESAGRRPNFWPPTSRRRIDADKESASTRLRALRAGADDVVSRPFTEPVFLARIRSLLRARAELEDLRPRGTHDLVEGFAEQADTFEIPQRVIVLTPHAPRETGLAATPPDLTVGLSPALAGLVARDPTRFEVHSVTADLDLVVGAPGTDGTAGLGGGARAPDLIIIDAAVGTPDGMLSGDVFRLLSDLRSRTRLRLAAQLLILPPDTCDLAVMALDMSVDDLVTEDVSREELCHRIETLLRQKKVADGRRNAVRKGLEAAVIDPLTGLHNRRFALPHLAMLSREAAQTGRTFAVMMLDIDHFKEINDTHGHAAGDTVLCDVARRLRAELRARDLLARIGGEEFLVVLPDTTEEEACTVAERLRQTIARRPFDGNAPNCALPLVSRSRITVTLSVGVALGGDGSTPPGSASDLIDRADGALYAAKEAGRNTVTLSASAA